MVILNFNIIKMKFVNLINLNLQMKIIFKRETLKEVPLILFFSHSSTN